MRRYRLLIDQILLEREQRMNMIWHHDKCMAHDCWPNLKSDLPLAVCDLAKGGQLHLGAFDIAEQ